MAKRKIESNIWVDSILGTIFIYFFMFLVSNISAFKIFDAFDSIGQALEDMEMTDVAFSQLREPLPPDTSIVLVNFGPLTRAGIAEQIRIIDKYNPKVIGIDSFFKGYNEDTLGTLSLAGAIASAEAEVVMVAKVEQSDSLYKLHKGDEIYDIYYQSDSMFTVGAHQAMANLDTEAEFQDDVKICRRFPPQRSIVGGDTHIAFAAKMAELYDSTSLQPLLDRGNEFETINYRGDFVNFFNEDKFATRFYALDYDQVLREDFVPGLIKGKIVLFGFMGEYFGAPEWEDRFFTPLNPKIAGRANPDMFGPVIHANIVSMILNRDYVDTFSGTVENVLGVILCFFNVLLFSLIYRRMGAWYDGVTKLIQLLEVIAILFLIIQVFAIYSFKMELTIGLFAVALAGDLLEVYYGVIKNIFSKKTWRKVVTLVVKKRKLRLFRSKK